MFCPLSLSILVVCALHFTSGLQPFDVELRAEAVQRPHPRLERRLRDLRQRAARGLHHAGFRGDLRGSLRVRVIFVVRFLGGRIGSGFFLFKRSISTRVALWCLLWRGRCVLSVPRAYALRRKVFTRPRDLLICLVDRSVLKDLSGSFFFFFFVGVGWLFRHRREGERERHVAFPSASGWDQLRIE